MQQRITIPHNFECRDYQIPAWNALLSGKKRVVCCWHRGAGKDLFALNYFVWRMIKEPAVYLHCFPQYSQGKKAIWNSVHKTDYFETMSYLDHFPQELVKYKNSSDMRLELVNGAIYCVMGIDGKNAQLARGMNPSHVIISEYAYMDPESWRTIEPRVSQNKGSAIFLSTPNGQNHFFDLYNYALSGHDPDYFASYKTLADTKILTMAHIDRLREEGVPEDFIQQEYFCSFTRGAQGSYYGKQIQAAREDGRICDVSVSPDLPCYTAWDIGIGDANSIWIFQILNSGRYHVLHYYENAGEGLPHYIKYLDAYKSEHNILFAKHFVPHDMHNREYGSGDERLKIARDLGYEMNLVPKDKIDDGIQCVRSLLPHCVFDRKGCQFGIKCLDMYCKKWNDSLKVYYDEPLHNQFSHGADAFRCAAMGIKKYGTGKLSPSDIRDMRMRNYGY
jgi:phage terminase large subunit